MSIAISVDSKWGRLAEQGYDSADTTSKSTSNEAVQNSTTNVFKDVQIEKMTESFSDLYVRPLIEVAKAVEKTAATLEQRGFLSPELSGVRNKLANLVNTAPVILNKNPIKDVQDLAAQIETEANQTVDEAKYSQPTQSLSPGLGIGAPTPKLSAEDFSFSASNSFAPGLGNGG